MTAVLLVLAAVISGIFGRMGGSGEQGRWYSGLLHTNWRDIGCPVVLMAVIWLLFGLQATFWWAYVLTFLLTFGGLRTYWDRLFGYDCHWFSGLMVGVAAVPLCWLDPIFLWIVPIRALLLALLWHYIERLPARVWIWRQDVAVEFCRYAVSL